MNTRTIIRIISTLFFCAAVVLIFSQPDEDSEHWYRTFVITKTLGILSFATFRFLTQKYEL